MEDTQRVGFHTALVVGTMTIIGVGLGLTGFLLMGMVQDMFATSSDSGTSLAQTFVALVFLQSALTTFLIGPVVASIVGFASSLRHEAAQKSAIIGGLGSFIGFYPMIIISIVIMAFALSGGSGGGDGGSSFDLLNNVTTIVLAGLPTGLVGAASGFLGTRF